MKQYFQRQSKNTEAKVYAGSINFTFSCWYRPNTDTTAYNILTDYRKGRYTIFGHLKFIIFTLDYYPTESYFQVVFNNLIIFNMEIL
jgi:hypothetical protein